MDSKTLLLFGVIVSITMLQSNIKLPQEITSFVQDDFGKLFLVALTAMVGYYHDLHLGIMMGVFVALLIIKYDRRFFVVAEGFANKGDDEDMEEDNMEDDMEDDMEENNMEEPKKKEVKCPEGTKHVTREDRQVFSVDGDHNPMEACVADPTMDEETEVLNEVMEMGEELAEDTEDLPVDEVNNEDVDDEVEGFVGSRVREHFGCGCGDGSKKKIETFVNAPKDSDVPLAKNSYCLDKWGYDQAGCRYDMKSDPANDFPFGKPLANCDTYNDNNVNVTGTVFYPLNH